MQQRHKLLHIHETASQRPLHIQDTHLSVNGGRALCGHRHTAHNCDHLLRLRLPRQLKFDMLGALVPGHLALTRVEQYSGGRGRDALRLGLVLQTQHLLGQKEEGRHFVRQMQQQGLLELSGQQGVYRLVLATVFGQVWQRRLDGPHYIRHIVSMRWTFFDLDAAGQRRRKAFQIQFKQHCRSKSNKHQLFE